MTIPKTEEFDYGIHDDCEGQPGYPTDAEIDRWHDGALDALRGRPQASTERHYAEGYAHGSEQRKVRVVMPERPEGYYHLPVETFA